MRVGIDFAKEGPARFLSHLELLNMWQRALRRAEIPLRLTEGFNPHPRLAFASALPVGVESEHEYLDMELSQPLPPQEIARRLAGELPQGIRVNRVETLLSAAPALMGAVERASYQVEAPLAAPLQQEELSKALEAFWHQESILVERLTKRGRQEYDPRPGIYHLAGRVQGDTSQWEMSVRTGSQGNVRPVEVLQALIKSQGLQLDLENMRVRRCGLFVQGGRSPLEAFGG